MQVEIEQLPELRLGTVHHVGPFSEIGQAFAKLGDIAGKAGLFANPDAAMVATYHGDPRSTPAEELESDAGVVLPADAPVPDGLEETHVPAGRYARYTHIGPFEGLPDAWMRLTDEWLPASGHHAGNGPALEIYRSDMRTTPREELRTDLYVPLDD
jgi:AraC family transcriptional regulator